MNLYESNPPGPQHPIPPVPPPLLPTIEPLPANAGWRSVLDAVLKRPASLALALEGDSCGRLPLTLRLVALVCLLAYGLVVGLYSGGVQLYIAPVKFAAGMLFAAVICLPSLYIFSAIGGARQNLMQVARLLGLAMALTGMLLVGFAPIAWVFTQSTKSLAFMGFLHLLFWAVALLFGLHLLLKTFRQLNGRSHPALALWSAVFVVVALQMTTTLRPLLGTPDHALIVTEKKFFLQHWVDCINQGDRAK